MGKAVFRKTVKTFSTATEAKKYLEKEKFSNYQSRGNHSYFKCMKHANCPYELRLCKLTFSLSAIPEFEHSQDTNVNHQGLPFNVKDIAVNCFKKGQALKDVRTEVESVGITIDPEVNKQLSNLKQNVIRNKSYQIKINAELIRWCSNRTITSLESLLNSDDGQCLVFQRSDTCITFSSKLIVNSYKELMKCQSNGLKLCIDGTYKILNGQWVLLVLATHTIRLKSSCKGAEYEGDEEYTHTTR